MLLDTGGLSEEVEGSIQTTEFLVFYQGHMIPPLEDFVNVQLLEKKMTRRDARKQQKWP